MVNRKSTPKNTIAEWFGHRIHPVVADLTHAQDDQRTRRCPFLSKATESTRTCIKTERSQGVCTISSYSNGMRQDWLACPYRALDFNLLEGAARRLFRLRPDEDFNLMPVTRLEKLETATQFRESVKSGIRSIVYFQDKLGGEISLSATDRSPEFSFDATMVEVRFSEDRGLHLGEYGIFEIQTMDFHGTYGAATKNLQDALRLHENDFGENVLKYPEWASEKIEGPNIANAFKRTFYQMMFKFQIGAHEHSAGCALAIPEAVWDSWQRHLGRPELVERSDGTYRLAIEDQAENDDPAAWIYVFDLDTSDSVSPNNVVIRKVIGTDAAALSHYALDVAPQAALEQGGSVDRLLATIQTRLGKYLPEFKITTKSKSMPMLPDIGAV